MTKGKSGRVYEAYTSALLISLKEVRTEVKQGKILNVEADAEDT